MSLIFKTLAKSNEKFPLEEIDNEGIDHYSKNEHIVTDKKRSCKKNWSKIRVNE